SHEIDQAFEAVVVPTSSGSTHMGLAMGLAGMPTKVIGVACDPEPDMIDDLVDLSAQAAAQGYGSALAHQDIDFRLDWVGTGYGVASEQGEQARSWLAEKEGIVLDPIYSGKAFAGLLSMARQGELKGKVLFWHTGGFPMACVG
ncbi:MAG: pyridoxal-phosphate dependent enzyme, partial [Armatimonadota bacterium]